MSPCDCRKKSYWYKISIKKRKKEKKKTRRAFRILRSAHDAHWMFSTGFVPSVRLICFGTSAGGTRNKKKKLTTRSTAKRNARQRTRKRFLTRSSFFDNRCPRRTQPYGIARPRVIKLFIFDFRFRLRQTCTRNGQKSRHNRVVGFQQALLLRKSYYCRRNYAKLKRTLYVRAYWSGFENNNNYDDNNNNNNNNDVFKSNDNYCVDVFSVGSARDGLVRRVIVRVRDPSNHVNVSFQTRFFGFRFSLFVLYFFCPRSPTGVRSSVKRPRRHTRVHTPTVAT